MLKSNSVIKHKWTFVIVVLLMVFVSFNAYAQLDPTATSKRIDGVTEFLLDRAQDNYFFIFEKNIKDNRVFACYMPNTYTFVAAGDLKMLLTAGSDAWGQSVEEDIKGIVSLHLLQVMAKAGLKDFALSLTDGYIEFLQKVKMKIGDQTYSVTSIPVDASEEVKTNINKLYDKFNKPQASLIELYKELNQYENRCVSNDVSLEEVEKAFNELKTAANDFNAWWSELKGLIEDKKIEVDTDQFTIGGRKAEDVIKEFLKDLVNIEKTKKNLTNAQANNNQSALLKVIKTERVISDGVASNEVNPLNTSLDSREYQDFRRYALFFAQISEAESSSQVKALLKEVTLPPVSFGLKRKPEEYHLMITAYLGYAAGYEATPSDYEGDDYKGYSGVLAPVGFEYSYGRRHGDSFSVMLAPFDFGHPVNLKLEGKEESVDWSDIVNPGVYLAYGVKELPLTVGVGYSRGRAIRTESPSEDRAFLFFAFDMPLFNLY